MLDAKRQNHWDFARPAAGRRDRGQVRRRPAEVDLGRRRSVESLMRAEVRVVDEAQRTAIPIAALQEPLLDGQRRFVPKACALNYYPGDAKRLIA